MLTPLNVVKAPVRWAFVPVAVPVFFALCVVGLVGLILNRLAEHGIVGLRRAYRALLPW